MEFPHFSRKKAFGLVVVASLSYTCLMFVWFSLSAFLPLIIEDTGLTNTEAGILVGAVPITYIPLALVSGLLVDQIGPGRIIGIGVLTFGTGQIGRGIASDFFVLLVFTLLIGVGATAITFGLPKLVSVLFPPCKMGRPSAIYLVGSSAGSALVFAIGRPILGPILGGWRSLFFWSGVVSIFYGFGWLYVTKYLEIDSIQDGEKFALDSMRDDLKLVLSHRELQFVVVIGTMYLLLNHTMQGWLPTILESRGLTAEFAGQATSLFVVAFICGVLLIPEIADRFHIRRLALMICGFGAFCGIAGVIAGGTDPLTPIAIIVAGVSIGGVSPLIRAIPPLLENIGSRLTGTAVGFIFAVGEIGGFFGPILLGVLYDRTGSFTPGLGILLIGCVIIVFSGYLIDISE